MELVLELSSVGVVDDEALVVKLFMGGVRLDVVGFLYLDLSLKLVDGLVEVGGAEVVEAWL